jgi:hypothetical protein
MCGYIVAVGVVVMLMCIETGLYVWLKRISGRRKGVKLFIH